VNNSRRGSQQIAESEEKGSPSSSAAEGMTSKNRPQEDGPGGDQTSENRMIKAGQRPQGGLNHEGKISPLIQGPPWYMREKGTFAKRAGGVVMNWGKRRRNQTRMVKQTPSDGARMRGGFNEKNDSVQNRLNGRTSDRGKKEIRTNKAAGRIKGWGAGRSRGGSWWGA